MMKGVEARFSLKIRVVLSYRSILLHHLWCPVGTSLQAARLPGCLAASTGSCQCGSTCVSSPHKLRRRRQRATVPHGPAAVWRWENYLPQERNRVLLVPLNRRRNAELRGDSGRRLSGTAGELLLGVKSTLDTGRQRTGGRLIQREMKCFPVLCLPPPRSAPPPSVRHPRR